MHRAPTGHLLEMGLNSWERLIVCRWMPFDSGFKCLSEKYCFMLETRGLSPLSGNSRIDSKPTASFRLDISPFLGCPSSIQPSATSSSIITAKPTMVPIVAISGLPPHCDSGMTSSTTTKTIAPAAKANA
jgi:hypothetical protein